MKVERGIPKVTVLMAAYNAEHHLAEAIESILRQTFTDFEFIVVLDGCTDASPRIAAGYAAHDVRLRVVVSQCNAGLACSLNQGLGLARGTYVARMDADDISLPGRLDTQVAFLDAHPEYGLCGGAMLAFSQEGEETLWQPPQSHEDIVAGMIFESTIYHPTVMLRRELLERHDLRYAEEHRFAQDYELWTRLAAVGRLANLPEVILRYRQHPGSVSSSRMQEQVAAASQVRLRLLERLGIEVDKETAMLHHELALWRVAEDPAALGKIERWLTRLHTANERVRCFPEPAFSRVLGQRWYFACEAVAHRGPSIYRRWRAATLVAGFQPPFKSRVMFFLRTLFRCRQRCWQGNR